MIKQNRNNIITYHFEHLTGIRNLVHFVTTRKGGVSHGKYETLNLGIAAGDQPGAVQTNRRLLAERFNIRSNRLVFPVQTHSSNVQIIDNHFISLATELKEETLMNTDALITTEKDICLAVTTADCLPLLLFEPQKKVIAAIHAGWRGTVGHIVPKTVRLMQETFDCDPSIMLAAVGPGIGAANYEVGPEVVKQIEEIFPDNESILLPHPHKETGKKFLDLVAANRTALQNAGISPLNTEESGLCTFDFPDEFFSARRDGIRCGRMATGICLKSSPSY